MRDVGDRIFPELQILLRRGGRVSYVNLTGPRQVAAAVVFLGLVVAMAFISVRFQHFGTKIVTRNHALVEADRAKVGLSQELSALRDSLAEAESRAEAVGEQNDQLNSRLSNATQELAALESAHKQQLVQLQQRIGMIDTQRTQALAEAQRRIVALDVERTRLASDRQDIQEKLAMAQDGLATKSSNVAQLAKALTKSRDLLRHSDSNQVALQTRIAMLEKDLAQANLSTDQFKSQLVSIEHKLMDLTVERDRLVAQRNAAQHAQRQSRLGKGIDNSATVAALDNIGNADTAGAIHTASADAVAANLSAALSGGAGHRIETLLASTGLDVKKLLKDISASSPKAEGGPFVPLGDAMTASEEARRHKLLEKLMETLPLRAPLDHYRVTSPFGARTDPFNHRRAFHEGVDLAGSYRAHVYSTAPGTVIFAGPDDGFGRLVKIDVGHGIVTMFAHMHRIFVVRGQNVPAHFPLGEMGCTGRCDGAHVHYQIMVDGTPVNPAKFLGAGGNVIRVGAKQ
jgi:murein DD-endopeptidase MepM/ murein hydrolase activator NlpD